MKATPQTPISKALLTLEEAKKILTERGFFIDEAQPYISGERFLMAKSKLVLAGSLPPNASKVIIKISNTENGRREIRDEKNIRDLLESLSFANKAIALPKEIFYSNDETNTIWVTEFIEQEKIFVSYSIEEQFFIALRAFEAQEAFHATTFEHIRKVAPTFEVFDQQKYLDTFNIFVETLKTECGNREATRTLTRALKFFAEHLKTIERYGRFLTHTDFVPHNFRIKNKEIYMLDCSAVHFGNKYEGWARFLNYMYIHNPALEHLLAEYIRKNRGEEEYLSLRLMRIYKAGHLLAYYARSLKDTTGDLHSLTELRLNFWNDILKCLLADVEPTEKLITTYRKERTALRSPEEKERQKDFAAP